MKILNLDDIVLNSERSVKYQGVSYLVKDFDVGEFITFNSAFKGFSEAYSTDDMEKIVTYATELTKLGVPEFPIDKLKKLNPIQLLALVSMIANLMPTPEDDVVAEAGAGEVDKKEEKAVESLAQNQTAE